VTEVVIECDSSTETVTGDVVVVSCGAANSAKLLLASANDKHPNGLANASGQIGRNYMFHYSQAVLALSTEPTVFQKTLCVNDLYFGDNEYEYPMGNIQMVGKSQGEMYKGEKPIETKLAPTFALRDIASQLWTSGSRPRTCRSRRIASPWRGTATSSSRTSPATRSPASACTTS
jgi:choline dehydrogenase-like flavoprotein